MEEKERYELQEIFEDGSFYWCLKDNDTKLLKPLVNLHNCVDLLNQQDKEIKQLKQSQKELAIGKLEKIKNYFNDSNDDKYNESEGWIITNRNVVDYVNKQIEELKGEK